MADIIIDAGTLTASKHDRIVTGLLLPYGEECRSNLGRFTYDPGVVELPSDLTGMSLNVEHRREDVIGAPITVTETNAGIVATFKIADTPEGDQALDDIATGKRKHLSAEVSNVKIKDGKGISGRLFAAALVETPAFPSATLLAAAENTLEETPMDNEETIVTEATGETAAGEPVDQQIETTETEEVLEDGTIRKTRTEVIVTEIKPTDTPTEQPTDQQPPTEQEPLMATATVPNTLEAKASSVEEPQLADVFSLMARAQRGEPTAETLLAALSDIKVSGSGALPAAGVLQPAWLGQLWQGRSYQRKYIPLINQGTITAIDEKGFTISSATELVQTWAGNKAEISSGTASTTLVSSTLQRWGYAADIAREFFDIPGNEEVIAAFMRLITESYARVTDVWTNTQLVTAAGTPVAADTYPTGYAESIGMLLQGIQTIEDNGDAPTFAIANELAWKELLYTPRDEVPEFIALGFGFNEASAAGSVRVVKGNTGIDDTASVIVGSRAGAHVNELAGASPLMLDALDIAKGGVDRAVVGYTQFMADRPDSIVLIGTADAA